MANNERSSSARFDRDGLWKLAVAVLERNRDGTHTVPARGQYPGQWGWDTPLQTFGLRHVDWVRAVSELERQLSARSANGRVPHIVFSPDSNGSYFPGAAVWNAPPASLDSRFEVSGIVQPPLQATAALGAYQLRPDKLGEQFLRGVFPALSEWHHYLDTNRSSSNGLLEIWHPWEAGRDNSPSFDTPLASVLESRRAEADISRVDCELVDGSQRPTDNDYTAYLVLLEALRSVNYAPTESQRLFRVNDVLFNVVYARASYDLNVIARILGEPREARRFERRADAVLDAIDRILWDEAAGFYFDRDAISGELLPVATVGGLSRLFGHRLDGVRTGRLVQMLHQRFVVPGKDGSLVLPTVARDEDQFDPRRYWRGSSWLNTTWLVTQGLRRHGCLDDAVKLEHGMIDLVTSQGMREYFEPFTGAGLGVHDFSWTAALTIDTLAVVPPPISPGPSEMATSESFRTTSLFAPTSAGWATALVALMKWNDVEEIDRQVAVLLGAPASYNLERTLAGKGLHLQRRDTDLDRPLRFEPGELGDFENLDILVARRAVTECRHMGDLATRQSILQNAWHRCFETTRSTPEISPVSPLQAWTLVIDVVGRTRVQESFHEVNVTLAELAVLLLETHRERGSTKLAQDMTEIRFPTREELQCEDLSDRWERALDSTLSPRWLVAVDAREQTQIRVTRPSGQSTDHFIAAPMDSSHGRVAVRESAERIADVVAGELLRSPAAADVPIAIVVAAATFTGDVETALPSDLAAAFARINHHGRLLILGDAEALLLGANPDGCGVACLAATGSVVIARRPSRSNDDEHNDGELDDGDLQRDGGGVGEYARFGGQEWPASDEGSNFHIGLRALHVAKQIEDALTHTSDLIRVYAAGSAISVAIDEARDFLTLIRASTDLATISALSRRLVEPAQWQKADIARIGVLVADRAENQRDGDTLAGIIMAEVAESLAISIAAALDWRHRGQPSATCVVIASGTLLVQHHRFVDMLATASANELRRRIQLRSGAADGVPEQTNGPSVKFDVRPSRLELISNLARQLGHYMPGDKSAGSETVDDEQQSNLLDALHTPFTRTMVPYALLHL